MQDTASTSPPASVEMVVKMEMVMVTVMSSNSSMWRLLIISRAYTKLAMVKCIIT